MAFLEALALTLTLQFAVTVLDQEPLYTFERGQLPPAARLLV